VRGRLLAALQRRRARADERRLLEAAGRSAPAPGDTPRVFYGHARIPGADEVAYGGMVKFQSLQGRFPNAPLDFNLVYLGSSSLPRDVASIVELARARGAPLLWNQNGVAYPAWAGDRTDALNEPQRLGLHAADHVVYQTEFCKLSADRFLGERTGPWEILPNPVDTKRFTPAATHTPGLVLVLGGTQYEHYRLTVALDTFAHVARERPEARLLVTGKLSWSPDHAANRAEALDHARRLGVADRVELMGPYTQAEAPEMLRRGHVLLHTKVNDPCPSVVLEALACGLPVVYSASGGVPELVGDGGIGVQSPLDWERIRPPAPEQLAEAVLAVAESWTTFAAAARARSERYDVSRWVERHAELFGALLSGR
jgi:glycosyltransferase involved in cell wall biosynthesis